MWKSEGIELESDRHCKKKTSFSQCVMFVVIVIVVIQHFERHRKKRVGIINAQAKSHVMWSARRFFSARRVAGIKP